MRGRVSYRAMVIGLTAVAVSAGAVVAQDDARVPAGLRMTLDVIQSFQAGDNLSRASSPTGSSILSTTDLTFGVSSETRAQFIGLELGARARIGDLPDEGGTITEIANPFAALSYRQTSANAELSFDASVRESALRDQVLTALDLETLEIVDLVIDNGTRRQSSADLQLKTGVDGPVETSLRLRFDQRRYDSLDTSLNDRDLLRFNGSVRLAATQNTDILIEASASDEDLDNTAQLQIERSRLSVGVITDVTEATQLDLRIGTSRIDVTETTGSSSDTALVGRASLRHDLSNGSVSASFNSDHFRSGTRQTLRFERALDLPSGTLSFALGATQSDTSDLAPIVSLAYRQEFKRAALLVNVAQTARGNSEAEEYLNSRASIRYVQEISQLSQLDLNLNVTDVEQLSTTGAGDQQRITFSAAVNHELSEDWSLSTGYRHEEQSTNGVTTLRTNEVFATFRRSFDLRP